MGKKQYRVESQFDDLHGDPADDDVDIDVDLKDSDNPIIQAALSGAAKDDDWQEPRDKDDKDDDEDDDDKVIDGDDDDDDDLPEMDDDKDADDDDDKDDDDDDDDDDDTQYGKNVRNRIERERNLRKAAEGRLSKTEHRLAKLESKQEVEELTSDFRKLESKAERDLKKLRVSKKAALEEGDTDAQIDIDEEILDIKADIKSRERALEQAVKDAETSKADEQDTSGIPDAGKRWIEKYPQFNTNARFQRAVLAADKYIAGLGDYDKDTDEYYEEIAKVVSGKFPKIIKRGKTVKKSTKRKARRSAVGGTQKAGTRSPSKKVRKGQIRLTKADQANMRLFGMDPTNKAHIKEYALNKEE